MEAVRDRHLGSLEGFTVTSLTKTKHYIGYKSLEECYATSRSKFVLRQIKKNNTLIVRALLEICEATSKHQKKNLM